MDAAALGSVYEEVFSAISIGCSGGGVDGAICAGGYFLKKLRSRGGRAWARWMWCCIAAMAGGA